MNELANSIIGALIGAGVIAPTALLPHTASAEPGLFPTVASTLAALPPSAAGLASAPPLPARPAATEPAQAYLGGSKAAGRVAQVYVKVGDNVFLAVQEAPAHLQQDAERWVDIEFPETLANDTAAARARLNRSFAEVQVGDVVEIKFAHKDNPRYFPVKDTTQVTELVAEHNEMLAKDFERRILARYEHGNTAPGWLIHAGDAPLDAAAALRMTAANPGR